MGLLGVCCFGGGQELLTHASVMVTDTSLYSSVLGLQRTGWQVSTLPSHFLSKLDAQNTRIDQHQCHVVGFYSNWSSFREVCKHKRIVEILVRKIAQELLQLPHS